MPAAPSQIVVIHGPAGGVGKTTIAMHLAYLFAAKRVSTVLVDLSQYGAVAPWLRLPRGTSSGVAGLVTALSQGDLGDSRLRSALVPAPDGAEHLHLLLSSGPAKMDQLKAADVEQLVRHLSATAQVVIIDTGSELTERVLGAMLGATRTLLVVSPDVTTGWHALEFLDLARSAYISRDRLAVVFNRVRAGSPYSLDEYRQVIGLPVLGTIPEAADLQTSAARGGATNIQGKGPGLRALRQLAHELVPVFDAKELKRSWLLSR